ncbi:hypothetical protein C8R45DRAFT_938049 [Mycena sanguinolenta]|nr:hypothetical protein C8R45DRAFT_938049 [Mycena sanguinolenta]
MFKLSNVGAISGCREGGRQWAGKRVGKRAGVSRNVPEREMINRWRASAVGGSGGKRQERAGASGGAGANGAGASERGWVHNKAQQMSFWRAPAEQRVQTEQVQANETGFITSNVGKPPQEPRILAGRTTRTWHSHPPGMRSDECAHDAAALSTAALVTPTARIGCEGEDSRPKTQISVDSRRFLHQTLPETRPTIPSTHLHAVVSSIQQLVSTKSDACILTLCTRKG